MAREVAAGAALARTALVLAHDLAADMALLVRHPNATALVVTAQSPCHWVDSAGCVAVAVECVDRCAWLVWVRLDLGAIVILKWVALAARQLVVAGIGVARFDTLVRARGTIVLGSCGDWLARLLTVTALELDTVAHATDGARGPRRPALEHAVDVVAHAIAFFFHAFVGDIACLNLVFGARCAARAT